MKKITYILFLFFASMAISCTSEYIYPLGSDGEDDDPPIVIDPTP